MDAERVRGKQSDHVSTPAGTMNSIQGATVLGTCTSHSATDPVMLWVVR
jgi:hypothetical protein